MSIANVNVCEWEGGDLNCVYVRDKGGGRRTVIGKIAAGQLQE